MCCTLPVDLSDTAQRDGGVRSDLWERTAQMAAYEARAAGVTLTFAPMLDITRDPAGDASSRARRRSLLGAQFARAKVSGFQGTDPGASDAIGATAKHFGAYGAVTAGRDYASAIFPTGC